VVDATRLIPDGQRIRVHGSDGVRRDPALTDHLQRRPVCLAKVHISKRALTCSASGSAAFRALTWLA
jgi:hypothetical protein